MKEYLKPGPSVHYPVLAGEGTKDKLILKGREASTCKEPKRKCNRLKECESRMQKSKGKRAKDGI